MGESPKSQPQEPCFPLMIFSHGMGVSRMAHSSVCNEFASYGFMVCAVEHRDGSEARPLVNHLSHGKGSRKEWEAIGHVHHDGEELRHGFDAVVDFVIPKQNPYDTSRGNEQGIDREFRATRIDLRLTEIEEAHDIVKNIAAGQGSSIAGQYLRNADGIGSSSGGV